MEIKINLTKGDITNMKTDAIVNAANSSLLGGGGVDGAIHRAGGPAISEACKKIRERQGGCPTGEAVITTGGLLPAKYVIHTVGPVWHGGHQNENRLLASAYQNSLLIAAQYNIQSIAFPNISTGVYGFPKTAAASIAVATIKKFHLPHHSINEVFFVCFDEENFRIYAGLLS